MELVHKPKQILVTGGAGFIGSNFVKYWLASYPKTKIVVLDSLTYAGNIESIASEIKSPQCIFEKGSIMDRRLIDEILEKYDVDTIVNFAAESHVDRSISGAGSFVETNIVGTFTLLESAKSYWLNEHASKNHKFHHISTDEVYGTLTSKESAFTESNQYLPNSPYAASKAASDHLVRSYHHTYGMCVTTSNCSNNYGPYHFPEKLIPLAITNILSDRTIPIYGDGKQIRDWLFVNDHCRAIDLVIHNGRPGEVYNVGGDNEATNISIILSVCRAINDMFADNDNYVAIYPEAHNAAKGSCEELITYVEDRPGHDKRYAVDARKIRSELGFQVEKQLEQGILDTVKWYLDNKNWWSPLV